MLHRSIALCALLATGLLSACLAPETPIATTFPTVTPVPMATITPPVEATAVSELPSPTPPAPTLAHETMTGTTDTAQALAPGGDGVNHDLVFSIPVGQDGVTYQGCGIPEAGCWGPTAFNVAPDGSFWIGDTQANRLLHYSPVGERINTIDLTGSGNAISQIEVTAEHVLALGEYETRPAVLRLNQDGELVSRYDLPFQGFPTGFAVTDQGEILVELVAEDRPNRWERLVDANGTLAPAPVPGYLHGGRVYQVEGASVPGQTRGQIIAAGVPVAVTVEHSLGGLELLGVNADRSFYVRVDDMLPTQTVQIDQTVRHYSADGRLLGEARVPIMEQFVPVGQGLAVGPDGAVYALLARPDRVEVQRLRFAPRAAALSETQAAPSAEPSVTVLVETPPVSPTMETGTVTPTDLTIYTHPEDLWSIAYPASLFQVEDLGEGVIVFISADRGTVAAIDTYLAEGNAYGNTGEDLRNRARDTLERIYSQPPNESDIIMEPERPWETGVLFTTYGGSKGEAVYEQRQRDRGDLRVHGFLYGYKADAEATMLPLLQAMRRSFQPKLGL